MPGSKKPKLTIKQARFVKAKAEGKSGTQAYMEAYGSTNPNVAKVEASRTLTKPNVQEALQAELERQGLTLPKLVKPVVDAIEATKIVTSHTEPDYEVPDHSIRLKGVQIAAKWMGVSDTDSGNTYNFTQINNEMRGRYSD